MNSVLQSGANSGRAIVVSPRQAAIGTFLGGPIGYIYFIRKNYVAVDEPASARKLTIIGIILLLAWNVAVALDMLTPRPISIAFDFVLKVAPFVLVVFARQHAQIQFKSLPRQYDFYSNWGVVGSGMLCLLASLACFLPAVIVVAAVSLLTA